MDADSRVAACGDKLMFEYIEGLLQDDDIDELNDDDTMNEPGEVTEANNEKEADGNDEKEADGNDEKEACGNDDSDCSLFVDISASHSGTSVSSAEIVVSAAVTPVTELLHSDAQSVGACPDLPEFSERSEVSHRSPSVNANLTIKPAISPHKSNSEMLTDDCSASNTIENSSDKHLDGWKNPLVIPTTVERLHGDGIDRTPCSSPASRATLSENSSVHDDNEDSESTATANTPSMASASRSAGDLAMVCGDDSSETDSAEEEIGKKDDPRDPTWMHGCSAPNGSPLSKLRTSLGQRVARKRKRLAMRGGRGLQHLTSNVSEKQRLMALAASSNVRPEWLRPFDFGWKREIVMRNVDDSPRHPSAAPRCDIYYYSPENMKLRSAPEITEYLIKTSSEVGTECFTFSKFPIHREPFEIVRAASRCPMRRSAGSSRNTSPVKSSSGLMISKRSPDSKRLVFKIKQTAITTNGEKRARLDDGAMHIDLLQLEKPSRFRFAKKRAASVMRTGVAHRAPRLAPTINGNTAAYGPSGPTPRAICGLSCPGLIGIPPSLNCIRCMCLFHPSCIGGPQSSDSFVCQWCRAACQNSNRLPLGAARLNVLGTIRGPPRLTPAPNVINPGLPRLQRATTSTTPSIFPPLSNPLALPALRMFPQQPMFRTTAATSTVIVVQPPSVGTFVSSMSVMSAPGTSCGATFPPPPLIMRSIFPSGTGLSSSNILPITLPSRTAPFLFNTTGTRPSAVLGSVAPVRAWLPGPLRIQPSPIRIQPAPSVRHILKLPSNISSQLNMHRPVALRINNQRMLLQPSDFVVTPNGVSVILPSETVEKSTAQPDLNSPRISVNRARRVAASSNEVIDVDAEPASFDLDLQPEKSDTPSNPDAISLPAVADHSSESAVIQISPSPSASEVSPDIVSASSTTATVTTPAVSSSSVMEETSFSIPAVSETTATSPSIVCNESTSLPSPCSESSVTPIVVDSSISVSDATDASLPATSAEDSCSFVAESRNDNCTAAATTTSDDFPSVPPLLSGDTTALPSTSQSPEENDIAMLVDSCAASPVAVTTNSPSAEAHCLSPTISGVNEIVSVSDTVSSVVTDLVPTSGAISPSNHDTGKEPAAPSVVPPSDHDVIVEPPVAEVAAAPGTQEQSSRRKRKRRISANHFGQLNTGVDTLLRIFRYLPLCDLLRASLVCRTWRIMATHPCLWSSVSLRRVRVTDWDRAAQHFTRVTTEHLDLRGCNMDGTASYLGSVFGKLITVRRLDLGPCPLTVANLAVERTLRLHQFSAESIVSFSSAKPFVDLRKCLKQGQLTTLRLRGVSGLRLIDPDNFSFKLPGSLMGLQTLMFADLGKLANLRTLRLESGGQCPDEGLYAALLEMKSLEQLELIRYTVDSILAAVLSSLQVRVLSLWPEQRDNDSRSALLNTCIMTSVCRMPFLRQFDWGIISDQSTGAVVVPLLPTMSVNSAVTTVSSAVEMTTINGLVATLSDKLPHTKIRVFRVPVVSNSSRRFQTESQST